jgi:hypothetical protein
MNGARGKSLRRIQISSYQYAQQLSFIFALFTVEAHSFFPLCFIEFPSNQTVTIATSIMPATNGVLENWKCLLACTLVSMSPFQYGIDFGAIGGLQAMKGFLAVR